MAREDGFLADLKKQGNFMEDEEKRHNDIGTLRLFCSHVANNWYVAITEKPIILVPAQGECCICFPRDPTKLLLLNWECTLNYACQPNISSDFVYSDSVEGEDWWIGGHERGAKGRK